MAHDKIVRNGELNFVGPEISIESRRSIVLVAIPDSFFEDADLRVPTCRHEKGASVPGTEKYPW